jgi:hypothetical protein
MHAAAREMGKGDRPRWEPVVIDAHWASGIVVKECRAREDEEGILGLRTNRVPPSADNGAVRLAPPCLRIAPDCAQGATGEGSANAATSKRGAETGATLRRVAANCTEEVHKEEKGPSRIRTGDGGFAIRNYEGENTANQGISEAPPADVAPGVAPNSPPDPNLARVVEAWPDLPDAIRGAVLALIDSANL